MICTEGLVFDKVWMYEEIMMNNDNLESSLLTSNLLKMLVQVELCVAGDEPTESVFRDLTPQVNYSVGRE